MTLTRYGIREWGVALLGALVLSALFGWLATKFWAPLWVALGILVWVCWVALAAFFRNPRRKIPDGAELILSPADGVVRDIEVVDFTQEPFTGKALRIGIFLSVLNVHLNRASADWQTTSKQYRAGRYLDARDPQCAKENEAMTLAGVAHAGTYSFPMGIRQISGAIARRIVCPVEPGRTLKRGQAYGMIKFGSRTELYLPVTTDIEVKVKVGDKAVAGETVMATVVAVDHPEQ